MSKIDIKVGETYYVRVKVTEIIDDKIITRTVSDKGSSLIESHTIFFDDEVLAFSPVLNPAPIAFFKSTVIPEAYPKYDPRRKFRKGDKVRPVERYGRMPDDGAPVNVICEVVENELTNGTVAIRACGNAGSALFRVTALYLELVTPVAELERYVLIHKEIEKYYDVCWKDDDEPDGRTGRTRVRNTYWYHNPPKTYTQQEAKAAAEAECARLNAEYRKEQNNV